MHAFLKSVIHAAASAVRIVGTLVVPEAVTVLPPPPGKKAGLAQVSVILPGGVELPVGVPTTPTWSAVPLVSGSSVLVEIAASFDAVISECPDHTPPTVLPGLSLVVPQAALLAYREEASAWTAVRFWIGGGLVTRRPLIAFNPPPTVAEAAGRSQYAPRIVRLPRGVGVYLTPASDKGEGPDGVPIPNHPKIRVVSVA